MNKNLLANESKRTGKPLSNRSRKIAIVGAGQAGLQLGVSLLERGGYDVTLLSDRSADAMASGRLQATAIMYHDKCRHEEALGLNFWDLAATPTAGFNMDVRDAGGGRQLSFGSPFQDGKGVAIDYRLKFPAWMREFERRGGELIIHSADMRDLETLRSENDLVLIASGKGGIQELFERDPDRSPPYDAPLRHIAVAAIDQPWPSEQSSITLIPGLGEIVFLPLLTAGCKRSTGVLLFSHPGSPMMKRFPTLRSGDDVLRTVREQVAHFCPEHSSLIDIANLTDDGAFLHGGLTPMVRKPVGRLPSGAAVMGMGDCVTVVDPLCGNGLNNAAVMAKLLSERIADHGSERFDENWMNRVFDEFWSYGSDVYVFMRALLEQPERLVKAIGAIPQCEALAADIINGYPDPQGFARWMKDDASSKAHLDLRLQSAA